MQFRLPRTVGSARAVRRRNINMLKPRCEGLDSRVLLRSGMAVPLEVPAIVRRGSGLEAEISVLARSTRTQVTRNIAYRSTNGATQRLDVYVPSGTAPRNGWPVVIAIHGGGWRRYNKEQYGPRAAVLTKSGFAVVAPNYTLSTPTRPSWPANLQDLLGVLDWTATNARQFALDPARVATMGESAGGHLALMLGMSTKKSPIRVRAIVNFYGPTELHALEHDSPSAAAAVSGLLGPLRFQNESLYVRSSPTLLVTSTTPPVLTFHGLRDWLVPPSQARKLDDALRKNGVDHATYLLEGAEHGFGFRAGGRNLLATTVAFLTKHLATD